MRDILAGNSFALSDGIRVDRCLEQFASELGNVRAKFEDAVFASVGAKLRVQVGHLLGSDVGMELAESLIAEAAQSNELRVWVMSPEGRPLLIEWSDEHPDWRPTLSHGRFVSLTAPPGPLAGRWLYVRSSDWERFVAKKLEGRLPAQKPKVDWRKQRISAGQRDLFRFFDAAAPFLPGGSRQLGKTALRQQYESWLAKQTPRGAALRRSAFEKMLDRYQQGWRVTKGQWILSR